MSTSWVSAGSGQRVWCKLKLPHAVFMPLWQIAFSDSGGLHIYFFMKLCLVNNLRCVDSWKAAVTHDAGCFGGFWRVVCKTPAVACGDSVWLLVTEAHRVHRLTSTADHTLEKGHDALEMKDALLQCNSRGHSETAALIES